VAPLLARWVDASWRTALASCFAVQAVACVHHYWSLAQGAEPAWRFVLWRLPSSCGDDRLLALRPGGWLAGGAPHSPARGGLLSQLVLIAECVLLGRWFGDGSVGSWTYAQDKVAIVLSSTALLAWSLALPAGSGACVAG